MRRVLITGAHSYIGTSLRRYLDRSPDAYRTDAVSMRDGSWRALDFSPYDAVVHTVGLAHVAETRENAPLYREIDCDLAVAAAEKAKSDGVGQFVFLSSMSVYGLDEGVIGPDTVPRPKSAYGRAKLEAEELLRDLETEEFRVAIVRPPMVYGEGCKGNYQALVRLAGILPVCPDYRNRRSMISIEQLCAHIRRTIDERAGGISRPRDAEDVCTCQMIRQIAEERGRRLPMIKALNFVPALLKRTTVRGRKAFGDLVYRDESQCGHAGV